MKQTVYSRHFAAVITFAPRARTLVRPSNDEMGAVTLQSALGNPTLQQRLEGNLRLWYFKRLEMKLLLFDPSVTGYRIYRFTTNKDYNLRSSKP